ncbi:MAG: glycosyltransferase [Thermoguttaceae bacterium]|nr:glycosyltransferase [Thermoguttaceae bacterium]
MKIIHFLSVLDPHCGGPPMVITRLAAAQACHGEEISLLAYRSRRPTNEVNAFLSGVPGIGRVNVETMPAPSRLEWVATRAAASLLRDRFLRTDLLHIHGVWEPVLCRAAAVARQCRVPYVVTTHGALDPWSLGQKWLKKRLALMLAHRRMLEGAEFIHALTEAEEDSVRQAVRPRAVEILPNGVFLEELRHEMRPGQFVAAHPELAGRPYVLFLSRLHYGKGLDLLSEAFARVAEQRADVRLVIAGPDYGERERLSRQLQRLGIASRVLMPGPLYGAEKQAALADAVCFCLPSRQEAFSMAILESLACGTPVVISDACRFPDVARVGAGRVVALNATQLAEALLEVLSDCELRRRMSDAGRRLVGDRFTWPQIASRMLHCYRDCRDSSAEGRLPSKTVAAKAA